MYCRKVSRGIFFTITYNARVILNSLKMFTYNMGQWSHLTHSAANQMYQIQMHLIQMYLIQMYLIQMYLIQMYLIQMYLIQMSLI